MSRFETYARLGGDDRFRWIAESNLKRFEELAPEVDILRARLNEALSGADDPHDPPMAFYELWTELDPVEEERDQCCIVACVFTALYFEALIYDYAASCLGDKYVLDHLDKLDFISKWVVIPRLTVGKEIDKSKSAFSSLKRLHRDRNSLVHLKSRPMNFAPEETIRHLKAREADVKESVRNCHFALENIPKELFELDPEHPKLQLLMQR